MILWASLTCLNAGCEGQELLGTEERTAPRLGAEFCHGHFTGWNPQFLRPRRLET
jgi:hypothetical protein